MTLRKYRLILPASYKTPQTIISGRLISVIHAGNIGTGGYLSGMGW